MVDLRQSKFEAREKTLITIFEMFNEGRHVKDIAEALEMTTEAVYRATYSTNKIDRKIVAKNNLAIKKVRKFEPTIRSWKKETKERKTRVTNIDLQDDDFLEKEKKVIAIFEALNKGETMKNIAKQVGISKQRVSQIIKGESEIHRFIIEKNNLIYNKQDVGELRKENRKNEKTLELLDEEIVISIFDMVNEGKSFEFVCNELNLEGEELLKIIYSEDYTTIRKKNKLQISIGLDRQYKDDQILELFKLRNQGLSYKEIEDKTKISTFMMSHILLGRSYKHVIRKYKLELNSSKVLRRGRKRNMSNENIVEIFRLKRDGFSIRHISTKFNCSRSTIEKILSKDLYKDVSEKYSL